ncbi:MAG: filamentous hemagglutinin N-terminal domain-containing protein [Cyanobacteria bacterium P01_E01_bin.42]
MARNGLGYCGLAVGCAIASAHPAFAQIVPDGTLGNEGSVVVPMGVQREQIEGGALRGVNLFHSFQEFNVRDGHSAYFLNPAVVENILSPVTGGNISEMFGTLGVLGEANLYLINPNGIIFGENASLDIKGSFVASTASSFIFPDGSEFNALNPEMPPLITNNVPIQISLQFEGEPATIVNLANLSTGGNLTLSGGNLDLEGELVAREDLTLAAEEMVKIRDGENSRFIAAAGNDLLIQGNEKVDIFALNHAESGLFSGGDMVLRSNNAVIGDAHYYSGGSFRIEELDGDLGELESPNDPVIRAQGDVFINAYQGASLHIIAGGKVEIPNVIHITRADFINGLKETIQLPNGSELEIDGKNEPTLDIRAGVNPDSIGSFSTIQGGDFFSPQFSTPSPSSADIKIGRIFFRNVNQTNNLAGQIFLNNQYKPNSELTGDIEIGKSFSSNLAINNSSIGRGGNVHVFSRGSIIVDGIIDVSAIQNSASYYGDGGNIDFKADMNIYLDSASRLISRGNLGGNITLNAVGNIITDKTLIETSSHSSQILLVKPTGGNIVLNAQSVFLNNRTRLFIRTSGQVNTGNILIDARESLNLQGQDNQGNANVIFNRIDFLGAGNGGEINIKSENFNILDGAVISNSSFGQGNSGNININSRKIMGRQSAITSLIQSTGEGNAGSINIVTNTLELLDGAKISTNVEGRGNAGNIFITAREDIRLQGENSQKLVSSIGSAVGSRAEGNGGEIIIITGLIELLDGARITANTLGNGNAGDISITTSDSLRVQGESSQKLASSIVSTLTPIAKGDGGNINIITNTLELLEGGLISNNVSGQGNGGNIVINAGENLRIQGEDTRGKRSGIFSEAISQNGNGGEIDILTNTLEILDGGAISTNTFRNGNAGNIFVHARENIRLQGENAQGFTSGIGSAVGAFAEGDGGKINITTGTLELLDGARITANTLGDGNAGNITVDVREILRLQGENSQDFVSGITGIVGMGEGNGGILNISTRNLEILDGARITTNTFGKGNAGQIFINAGGYLDLRGNNNLDIGSAIMSQVRATGQGRGGKVQIITETLSVHDRGFIATDTFGQGNAGSIDLTTNQLNVIGGSQIQSRTSTNFKAGDITLNIADRINIEGENSGIFANTEPNSTGNGGDIEITTPTLSIRDNATINVDSQGEGIGGNIEIQSDRIDLDNSQITAETRSTQGGNIELTVQDILMMRHGSQISTTAGTAQTGGDGGNITINAENGFLVGPPQEDNDITANAFEGNGGRIDVTAQAIFGLEFRDELTPLSDITASSEFGLDGTVQLNTLGIDPSNGLTNLPEEQTEPQVQQGCSTGGENSSSFTVQGIGGSPDNPDEMLVPDIDDEFISLDELETDGTIAENQAEIEAKNQTLPVFACSNGI